MSKLKKICHHFHLSLQSGSDETLKRMNRSYTTSEFEKIVSRLRLAYSDCILTTDIIVGFPGETEKEFEQTYEFLKKIKLLKMSLKISMQMLNIVNSAMLHIQKKLEQL